MKGIAVPYIIAVLLGIAVVFVIGAGFFSSSSDLQKQSCQNKLSTYCIVWRGNGYRTEPSGGWDVYAPECPNIGISSPDEPNCNKILGRTGVAKEISEDCTSDSECQTGFCDPTFGKCAKKPSS